MASLLAGLGSVCPSCATYNEPGVSPCVACAAEIPVASWVRGGAPAPAAARAAPAAAPQVKPAAARADTSPPQQGAPLLQRAVPSVCPHCHAQLQGAPLFCTSCGTRLADDARLAARRVIAGAPIAHVGSARLVLLRGTERENEAFRLASERTGVGRSQGALLLSHDPTLAPLAATFAYRDGRLLVIDEGGPSGVYVRIRAPEVLEPGHTFAIGDRLLRFSGVVEPAAASASPVLGSPRPPATSLLRLELLHGGGAAGRAWLRPAPLRIGRAIGDVLFGDDPFVSARHCELDTDAAGALLRDLGSSNGTFVRVPPGSERMLQDGDYVRLGRNILRIEIS